MTRIKPLPVLSALLACSLAAPPVTADDGVFDSNGVKIRYVTAGAGEAVVLIHGWMADSGMWGRDKSGETRLDTTGADGFRFIALDCRGHGKSDKPHAVDKYDAEVAADVVRLLDHLKVGKAHLIGYSSGAFVAGKVAATHPGRVLSVVYAGQAPVIGDPNPSDFSEVEAFAKAVDEGRDLGSYIIAVTPTGRPKPTEAQARVVANILYGKKDVKAFAAAGRGFKHLAVTEDELKRCPAPVLFIHGERESEHVQGKVAAARKRLGRGEVKVIPGGDHMTTLAKPEFRAALLDFLRANKAN
ncbi:MAG: alpha/beta hydrolase [Gemmataceae bacterium]